MDIENKLFPEAWKLRCVDGKELKSTIIDLELDPIECTFDAGDDYVELNTKEFSCVHLDIEILQKLISLIKESADEYTYNSDSDLIEKRK